MLSRKRNQSGAAPRKCDERMHFNACPCSSLGCWRAVKCKPSPLCELDIPADPPRRLMRHNTTKPRSIGIVTSLCYHPRYALQAAHHAAAKPPHRPDVSAAPPALLVPRFLRFSSQKSVIRIRIPYLHAKHATAHAPAPSELHSAQPVAGAHDGHHALPVLRRAPRLARQHHPASDHTAAAALGKAGVCGPLYNDFTMIETDAAIGGARPLCAVYRLARRRTLVRLGSSRSSRSLSFTSFSSWTMTCRRAPGDYRRRRSERTIQAGPPRAHPTQHSTGDTEHRPPGACDHHVLVTCSSRARQVMRNIDHLVHVPAPALVFHPPDDWQVGGGINSGVMVVSPSAAAHRRDTIDTIQTRCDAIRSDPIRYAMRCDAMRCDAMRCENDTI
eukprot:5481351-Prymnesium_polylepis.1